jgi:hypothetical protein
MERNNKTKRLRTANIVKLILVKEASQYSKATFNFLEGKKCRDNKYMKTKAIKPSLTSNIKEKIKFLV